MFSLHESSQRLICRALFVLCAVIPAAATLLWSAYSVRPWIEQDWQQALSQQLRVRVEVDQVIAQRPGVSHLENVRLFDQRSQQPLGSLDLVRAQWQGSQLKLEADRLQVDTAQFPIWSGTIATCLSASQWPACRLHIKSVELAGEDGLQLELSNLRCFTATGDRNARRLGAQAELAFDSQNATAPTLKMLVEQESVLTTASIDTGGAQLPTWLLAHLLPSLDDCPAATYAGTFRLQDDSNVTRGWLHGRFENLQLNKWFGASAGHELRAVGRIEMDQLQWVDQRVEVAHGSLYAAAGRVSRPLIEQFRFCLHCQPGPPGEVDAQGLLRFDELASGFHLTGTGLTLTGRCQTIRDGAPGCMLAYQGKPVLSEPEYANLPVGEIVRVLSQTAPSWMPASREANEMAGHLPLPRVGPVPEESQQQEVASQPKQSTTNR